MGITGQGLSKTVYWKEKKKKNTVSIRAVKSNRHLIIREGKKKHSGPRQTG